jgi:septum site-determining protein MinC
MEETIKLRGDRQGLRLLLSEEVTFDALLPALEEQLRRGEGFFRGSDLMVDIGSRELTVEQVRGLAALLEEWGVELRAIGTADRKSRGAIRGAGLRSVSSAAVASAPAREPATPPAAPGDALFITRTVRSGQSVRHHSHVVVLGDVNPGAEVIAAGDVVVWGRLRGVVHAGAIGDEEAIVCSLELSPMQLRIAGLASRSPEEGVPTAGAEVAHIEKGRIVVEPWDSFRRG